MNAVKELLKVAEKIENRFRKLAQTQGAQSADVQDALKAANLWGEPGSATLQTISNQVSALLNTAGVPENCAVKINVIVDKNLRANFVVDLTPPHASALILARLLKNGYAEKMHQAFVAAKLNITDTVSANWLNF